MKARDLPVPNRHESVLVPLIIHHRVRPLVLSVLAGAKEHPNDGRRENMVEATGCPHATTAVNGTDVPNVLAGAALD